MDRADLLSTLKNDVNALVQTVCEKYYRGRFPYGMDAVKFKLHTLHLIRDVAERLINEEEFLEKNLPE
ncbi:MAG: hypothetical protein Q8R40_01215 [bacterium]|nr:hypothetical protein [bacterium]